MFQFTSISMTAFHVKVEENKKRFHSTYSPFVVSKQVRPHLPYSFSRNMLNTLTFSPNAHTAPQSQLFVIASGGTEWRQNALLAPQGTFFPRESPELPLSLPNWLCSCSCCFTCLRSGQSSSSWSWPASWYLSNCSWVSFQSPVSCMYICWAGQPAAQVCPWDVTLVILEADTAASSRLPPSSRMARRLTFLLDTPFTDRWGSWFSLPSMIFILISVEKRRRGRNKFSSPSLDYICCIFSVPEKTCQVIKGCWVLSAYWFLNIFENIFL